MKIIACNSNKVLAEAITSYIGVKLADAVIRKFADGEIFVKINENIRGEDIFIIQTGGKIINNYSVNDIIMETLIIIDACKRSMAKTITLVMPCYPYARQDKKNESRAPISAKLLANLLEKSGIDRIVMLLAEKENIREITLFPMNQNAQDLLMGAPSIPNETQLKELNIKVVEKKK